MDVVQFGCSNHKLVMSFCIYQLYIFFAKRLQFYLETTLTHKYGFYIIFVLVLFYLVPAHNSSAAHSTYLRNLNFLHYSVVVVNRCIVISSDLISVSSL